MAFPFFCSSVVMSFFVTLRLKNQIMPNISIFRRVCLAVTFMAVSSSVALADACDSVTYKASVFANASTGRMAPYMIGSWNFDRTTMKNAAVADFSAVKPLSRKGRFSWGAGVEFMTGYQHGVDFARYIVEEGDWTVREMKPAAISLRVLYGEARYRSLYALVGMKYFPSKIVDDRLSSGDLIMSSNARPVPGVTVGFIDFQNIPFTNGWIQINGCIMYGKFMDNDFRRKQFNHFNQLIATDIYYTYKYCYFRTKPSERFSATFGMQVAGQFGGKTLAYRNGLVYSEEHRGFRMVDLAKMFFPTLGNGNGYYEGNSLGSWSLRARYSLSGGGEIATYWEKLFEDGSGIGCLNGTDGLYGLQFSTGSSGWFESALVEYLDFRNQSGPLHWAPGDAHNTSISTQATGGDNYYNNDTYGSYVNYGMAIGSPMVMAPIYNANGYPEFIYNRMQGIHAAVCGSPTADISYRVMAGWQKGYAMGRTPMPHALTDVSAMLQVSWSADRLLRGLGVDCRVAVDRGKLRGNNLGMALAVSYTGNFNLKE